MRVVFMSAFIEAMHSSGRIINKTTTVETNIANILLEKYAVLNTETLLS